MPALRTLAYILALPDLSPAETRLLSECVTGDWVKIGEDVPSTGDAGRRIRADILRYLALGGCPGLRPHERGVRVCGALILDTLDLQGCKIECDLWLHHCRFDAPLALRGARARTISLEGSRNKGIAGDRLKTKGSVYLRRGFRAEGLVRLLSAEIGGGLDCGGGTFSNPKGVALSADRLKTAGSVFLRDGFRAEGEVRLVGAEIGGNLSCARGAFINFSQIGESKETESKENALNANRARIAGALFWREGATATGRIDLTGARCGSLDDDRACWPTRRGDLVLDGFVYGSISGGPVDAAARLEWLALCDASKFGKDFWPQPYEQLAKVLREMGHVDDARTILVEKERLQHGDFRQRQRRRIEAAGIAREANDTSPHRPEMTENTATKIYRRQSRPETDLLQREIMRGQARPGGDSDSRKTRAGLDPDTRAMAARARRNELRLIALAARLSIFWSNIWQRAFEWTVGFGHRPFRAIYLLFALVILGSILFSQAWRAGQFAPNAAVILLSDDWATAQAQPNPAAHWARQSKAGRDYETYYSGAYAFDVVVPLIDLGQEAAWAPSTADGRWSWGWWGWWLRWLLKTLGWIVSALGAAAITGIIRRE